MYSTYCMEDTPPLLWHCMFTDSAHTHTYGQARLCARLGEFCVNINVCVQYFVCMVGNCDARLNDLRPSIAFIQADRAVGQRGSQRDYLWICDWAGERKQVSELWHASHTWSDTSADRFSLPRVALWVCVTLFFHLCTYMHRATTEAFCWWSKWHQIFSTHQQRNKRWDSPVSDVLRGLTMGCSLAISIGGGAWESDIFQGLNWQGYIVQCHSAWWTLI